MPFWLKNRKPHLQECMDDPTCDVDKLHNTYRQFSRLNPLLARWNYCYRQWIRPMLEKQDHLSLLDIGFGGGDIPIQLQKWAQQDGKELNITAIDPDPRALEFVQNYRLDEEKSGITFRKAYTRDLIEEGSTYDIVVSNHLLHHLDDHQLSALLKQTALLSRRRALYNDIQRSDLGWMLFAIGTLPLFRKSFIREDGLISIQRSYTYTELERRLPRGWQLKRVFPYRLVAIYEHKKSR